MVWIEARVAVDGHPYPSDLGARLHVYEPAAHIALRRPAVMEFRLDVEADDALAAVHRFLERLTAIALQEQFGPLVPVALIVLPF